MFSEKQIEQLKQLIEEYKEILITEGDPDEMYKYDAIAHFQKHWNMESENFHAMMKEAFRAKRNMIYQNSWGFIDKAARLFPLEVKEMFSRLYAQDGRSVDEKVATFSFEAEGLLPLVREGVGKDNINAQQDERTVSYYLACRFPAEYVIYKYGGVYSELCDYLNIDKAKTGQRFQHFQELAKGIMASGVIEETKLEEVYRKVYPHPGWDDKLLMVQNIAYVGFSKKSSESIDILSNYKTENLSLFFNQIDDFVDKLELAQDDERIVFNHRRNHIAFTVGQRYVLQLNDGSEQNPFGVIGITRFSSKIYKYKGIPAAVFNESVSVDALTTYHDDIYAATRAELNRTTVSGYLRFDNQLLRRMAFDKEYREDVLVQVGGEQPNYSFLEDSPDKLEIKSSMYAKNTILFGAPGTGKTYHTKEMTVNIIKGKRNRSREEILTLYDELVEKQQIVFTTFHQSMSYEDFIEGIKPETENGGITYEVKNGIFKQICINADISPNSHFVLIIDEINRGNIPAIFGELITLLEEDKRKGSIEEIAVTLPYSNEKFSVPSNLYIIGTMNTADRSVEALDTALRRRFSFREMQPEPELLRDHKLAPYQEVDLSRMLTIINKRIEILIEKDHQIGHSYFIGVQSLNDLKLVFKDKIIPLLEEYFFGDYGKIGLVIGGGFIYQKKNEAPFPTNFDYGDHFYNEKKVYQFTTPNEWDEQTFISIYEEE